MENRIQIIFSKITLFVVSTCYGQRSYTFDKIVISTFSTEYFPNQKHTDLFNSENDSYHMQIYNRNDSLVSRIFDTKESKVHYFYMLGTDSMKLKFLKTQNWEKFTKDYKFEFSEAKEKKDLSKVLFKIFNKKNKRIARYKFTVRRTKKNLFSIFKLSSLETLLFTETVPLDNFLVIEAKGTNTSGNYVEYKLDSIENIDLKVEIPL